MSNLMQMILGGVASGVILMVISRWVSGGPPPVAKHAVITDSPGAVVDQRSRAEINVVNNTYASHVPRGQSSSASNDDEIGAIAAVLVGAAAASLAFVFSWPVAVGIVAGTAVAVAVGAVQTWASTEGTAGPRGQIAGASVVTAMLCLLGSWWVVYGGPAGRPGMADTEAAVTRTFPRFDDGLAARWHTIASDPIGVLQVTPWRDVGLLVAGVAFMAVLTYFMACELFRWWSFRNVAEGRTDKPGRARRAVAYLDQSSGGRWVAVAMGAVVVLGCTSGYAAELIDWASSRSQLPTEAY